MKIFMTVEGTEKEIEKFKHNHKNVIVIKPIDVSLVYVTKPPKFRYKTLKELVDEFGDEVILRSNNVDLKCFTIWNQLLGWPVEAGDFEDRFKEIFVKEEN